MINKRRVLFKDGYIYQHYTYLDENDLKEIYDKVIPDYMIAKT